MPDISQYNMHLVLDKPGQRIEIVGQVTVMITTTPIPDPDPDPNPSPAAHSIAYNQAHS